jgi:hypothetical protein
VESVTNDQRDGLWRPAAIWFARRARTETRRPVEVTLVRRWRDLFPPGRGPSRGEWMEAEYYTLTITPDEAGG